MSANAPGAERRRVETLGRLENGLRQAGDWYHWGPYVSERQWGTVREDYSAERHGVGVPAARPRPLARLPLGRGRPGRLLRRRAAPLPRARALERARPDPEGADLRPHRQPGQPRRGRQGVLVVPRRDAEPLVEPLALPLPAGRSSRTRGSSRRTRAGASTTPSFELLDTGHLRRRPLLDRRGALREGRPARPAADGRGHERRARRPTRCTCCRPPGTATPGPGRSTARSPSCAAEGGARIETEHPFLGALELVADDGPDGTAPELLFCDNETNGERLFGSPRASRYPKDGINDHVVSGADSVNPERRGTKAAFQYRVEVAPGATVELRLRLRPAGAPRRPGPTSTRSSPRGGARRTSTTRS